MEELILQFFGSGIHRIDVESTLDGRSLLEGMEEKANDVVPRWKESVWDSNSVEPAMLRVPIVLLTFMVLWGLNVILFDRFKLQYHGVMSIKSMQVGVVFYTATVIASVYAFCMILLRNMVGFGVEFGVALFYLISIAVCSFPLIPGHEALNHFFHLLRLTFSPGNSISFAEVLTGDALTSLSKVLKDLGISGVVIFSRLLGKSPVEYHDFGMMLVAVLASLPFALRVRQCSVQFMGATDNWARLPIFLNIIKYMSAFPPIWLTAASSFGYFHPMLPFYTALFAAINSVYSFLWDIIMDWGLISFSRECKAYWRPRLLLPITFHVVAAVVNLGLRFSWAANRLESLAHMHPSHFILLIEVAEVCRRSMWNIFRVEWEIIVKQNISTVQKNTDDYSDGDDMIALVDRSQGKALVSP